MKWSGSAAGPRASEGGAEDRLAAAGRWGARYGLHSGVVWLVEGPTEELSSEEVEGGVWKSMVENGSGQLDMTGRASKTRGRYEA
jgi:hypothetical protein